MSSQTYTMDLSKKSLEILDNFRKQPDVEDGHYQKLVSVIKASPLLTERFNLAAENKNLYFPTDKEAYETLPDRKPDMPACCLFVRC